MRLTADQIKIDDDEGRFILVISTEEIGNVTVDFHACALAFEDEVRKELRPYALEAGDARAAVARGTSLADYIATDEHGRKSLDSEPWLDPDELHAESGYDPDDPKSPGYYERMVG